MVSGPEKIIVLEKVDSTNNYAMALIKSDAAVSGNAVFALEQTSGKGRRGKQWKSNKGENIILSIMVQMQWLPISRQFELSVAVALAGCDFVSKNTFLPGFIKWPNDIFVNDSKAGGVLIESAIKGTLWQWAVIGVGINVNQLTFGEFDFKPVSLKQLTGNHYDVLIMAEELRAAVLQRIEELRAGNFNNLLQEYNKKLFARNQMVTLEHDKQLFNTTIIGVSPSGQLITEDTQKRFFNFDEVTYLKFL